MRQLWAAAGGHGSCFRHLARKACGLQQRGGWLACCSGAAGAASGSRVEDEGSAVSHPAPAQQPGSNIKPTRRARRIMKRLKIAVEEAQRRASEAEQRAVAAEQEAAALQAQHDAFLSSWHEQKAAADKLFREQALVLAELKATVAWQQQELQQARSDEAALQGLQQEVARLEAAVEAAEERRRRRALMRRESRVLNPIPGNQQEVDQGRQLHCP
ncbi:hypothetical protein ABPG77_010915 [Micractinium sp. CCAP 211/92]